MDYSATAQPANVDNLAANPPAANAPSADTASVRRLGMWSSVLLAASTGVALALGVTTPPISGAFCTANCVGYPYANIAAYVPHDYLWMYPALLIAPLFVLLAACLHSAAPAARKIFSLSALGFAVMAATLLSADYYIQLETLQPSILNGESKWLALITQYNPHGIFIALEDLGYLLTAVAFLLLAPAIRGGRLGAALRWLLVIGGGLTLAARLVYGVIYGFNLEYRFEVTAIAMVWGTLIIAGILAAQWFRRWPGWRA